MKGNTVRKYWTKERPKYSRASSKLCISVSTVTGLLRSPTPSGFTAACLSLLGWFHTLSVGGIWHLQCSLRQPRLHLDSFMQWASLGVHGGTALLNAWPQQLSLTSVEDFVTLLSCILLDPKFKTTPLKLSGSSAWWRWNLGFFLTRLNFVMASFEP